MLEAAFVIVAVYFLYLFRRLILLLEKLVEFYGRKEATTASSRLPITTEVAVGKEREEIKTSIPELAPETIAPHLKRPPKSSGFGPNNSGGEDKQQR